LGVGAGLGAALARRFAARYNDALVAGSATVLGEVTDEIRAAGGIALPIQGDAAVEVEVATAHATIRNELGPIEILIYNGGRRPIAQPATIADAFWYLAHQDRRTWAHELDVRPFKEKF